MSLCVQDRLAELDEVPGLRARVEALEQARARLQAEVVDKDAAAAAAAHLMSVSQPHPVAGPISGWDALLVLLAIPCRAGMRGTEGVMARMPRGPRGTEGISSWGEGTGTGCRAAEEQDRRQDRRQSSITYEFVPRGREQGGQ